MNNTQAIDYANELARLRLAKKRRFARIHEEVAQEVEESERKQEEMPRKKKKIRYFFQQTLSYFNEAGRRQSNNLGWQSLMRKLSYDGADENLEENGKEEDKEMAQERIKAQEGEKDKKKQAEVHTKQASAEKTKKILRKIKNWSVTAALGTFGLSLIITVLVLALQFVGKYLIKIEALPKFDKFDYLLVLMIFLIFSILVAPIVIFMSIMCELSLGLAC